MNDNDQYTKQEAQALIAFHKKYGKEPEPMTDQPIIYWQDITIDNPSWILHSLIPGYEPAVCCLRSDNHKSDRLYLTADQARELGYALITRAIMATPIEELQNYPHEVALVETIDHTND